MQKEKIIKLTEALTSAGYEIVNINTLYNVPLNKYGDIEISLYHSSPVKNPFSKERLIELIEVLYSIEYGLVNYELSCKVTNGDINLVLQTL